MRIGFADRKVQELCEQTRLAERRLGAVGAKRLRSRLADLQAVGSVAELVAGRPHELHGDFAGHYALDLDGGRRLVFAPNLDPVPTKDDGGIDWTLVTAVRIVFIGDYHD